MWRRKINLFGSGNESIPLTYSFAYNLRFFGKFPHLGKWETTDCTNYIIWISQDKWKHLPWSLLFFWVYLVLKRKTNVLLVTKLSYKVHSFGGNSRLKFKEQTERWSKLKIHKNNEYHKLWMCLVKILNKKIHQEQRL